ncbi:MAG TPA: class I SAM-dependent methyltransferase [Gammaproteobacteria bacterium]|nr:class I SAM-dependent methyltransferase [Gammaproteobacteria bacterium]
MPAAGFKDHFSVAAHEYDRYRPGYPAALMEFLAAAAPGRSLAWDCATGTGQAAIALAGYFEEVVASDASTAQIGHAVAHPRVRYRVAQAEASGLGDGVADLVTVAQALHWLDLEPFYGEVRRVARPGAVFAAWTYSLADADPEIDPLVAAFYARMGPWWPPERAHVEDGYRQLPFPFAPLSAPDFEIREAWPLERLLGYFSTWSAVNRCRKETGDDPVESLGRQLARVWGDPAAPRPVRWPLHLRVGRVDRGWGHS